MSSCSFCGKRSDEVFRIISSDGSKVCNECIGKMADQIADEYRKVAKDVSFPPGQEGET